MIEVHADGGRTFAVTKSYDDFYAFHTALIKQFPEEAGLTGKRRTLPDLPAQAIHDLVRAMQPWPTASTYWIDPSSTEPPPRIIIHKTQVVGGASDGSPGQIHTSEPKRLLITTGSGLSEPLVVQLPGRKSITIPDFLRGNRLDPAGHFGQSKANA